MAEPFAITAASGAFFLGEDKILRFTLIGSGSIAGYKLAFVFKDKDKVSAPELLRKDNVAIGGVVITDAAARKVEVTFRDVDTDGSGSGTDRFVPKGSTDEKVVPYFGSLKRLDDDLETVLAWGTVEFAVASQVQEP